MSALTVGGAAPLRGRLRMPGDKSISHRALLLAAVADGSSTLRGLASGVDVRATRRLVQRLGVTVRGRVPGDVTVHGSGWEGLHEADAVHGCGNSGTTLRLATGLLAGRPFLSVLTGDASLRRRPMGRVVGPLRTMGAQIDGRADGTLAPLVVRGGALRGARHELAVASAQVKSSLLLAGLQAEGATTVVEPGASRDHTERLLTALGAPLHRDGRTTTVEGGAPVLPAFELDVPGDPSSAAFFAVAAIVTPGSDVVLEGIASNPTRTGFVEVLRRMGADVELQPAGERLGEPVADLVARHSALHATRVGGAEVPTLLDEVPALAVAAAFAEGVTEFHDAAELTVKESDRVRTVGELLAAFGIGAEGRADGLSVRGGRPHPAECESHGDHRVAMAAAVAGHALAGRTTVRGWDCVATSYPEFADHLGSLT